jgi:hypothetical protein
MNIKKFNLIHIVLIFLITICVAYIFGLILINLVDNRLSNIKLNIPKQEVIIKYPDEKYGNLREHFSSNDSEDEKGDKSKKDNKDNKEGSLLDNIYKKNQQKITSVIEYKTFDKNGVPNKPSNNKPNFDEDYYKMASENKDVEGFDNDFSNKNQEWTLTQKNKYKFCYKNHQHVKDGKNTGCSYGISNYADPFDMTPVDLRLFTLNYPPNMTMQDYISWLWCFKNMEDKLPYNHLKNLLKIKNKQELIQEDGVCPPPSYTFPSLDAESYFKQMYNDTNEFNIASPLNSDTGPMVGSNYDEYSEFRQNTDLFGRSGSIRNNDIYLKKDAKKLYNQIFPKDSNFIKMDDEYEIYHIKDVEL